MKHQQILKAFLPIHQVSLGNAFNAHLIVYIHAHSIFRAKWAKYNSTTLKKDWVIITCITTIWMDK